MVAFFKGVDLKALAWAICVPITVAILAGSIILFRPILFLWGAIGVGVIIYYAVKNEWWDNW